MAEELSNSKFNEFTKKGIVLIDFYADWCMPCVMMGPIIDEMTKKFKGKIKIGKVNVGENGPKGVSSGEEIAKEFNVSSIPNFILFKDGKEIERFVGSISEEELENKLKKYLK